jgi:hypothetical protein
MVSSQTPTATRGTGSNKSAKRRRKSSSKVDGTANARASKNNVIGAFVALPVETETGVRYFLFAKEHREASNVGEEESGGNDETNGSDVDADDAEGETEEGAHSASRSIFVTNVPLYWTEAHLQVFLGRWGQLASVQAGSARGARFARVRFQRSRDARALLRGVGLEVRTTCSMIMNQHVGTTAFTEH